MDNNSKKFESIISFISKANDIKGKLYCNKSLSDIH